MNQTKKLSPIKLLSIFILVEILFRLLTIIINTKFDFNFLFDWDFLIYEIGAEEGFNLLCATVCYFVTFKMSDFKINTVILRVLVFSLTYMISVALLKFILFKNLNLYSDFLIHLPYAIKLSLVFLVVWMVVKFSDSEKIVKTNPELVDN